MGPRIPVDVSYSPWHPTVPLAKNVSKATVATGVKRKISDLAVQPEVTKKRLVDPEVAGPGRSPLHGFRWDSADFSCAYDSLFTIIYNIWAEDTVRRAPQLSTLSREMSVLVDGFEEMTSGSATLEEARDRVRRMVHVRDPVNFPYGHMNASVDLLTMLLMPDDECGTARTKCTRCDYELSGTVNTFGHQLTVSLSNALHRDQNAVPVRMLRSTSIIRVPQLLCLHIINKRIELDPTLRFNCQGQESVLQLRGIVYLGELHFTSRIVTSGGSIWYHDGITTRGSAVYEGEMSTLTSLSALYSCRGREAVLAVYAVV
ncbi:hypothetical protein C8J57DRAFT_1070906 [Mycena rebaudengoi]|nr:hypothetical protein C8J57DRAFT_1070906 [Mycena rebaudengoi]